MFESLSFSVYNTLGTVGAIVLISAYFLLQVGRLKSNSLVYSLLNALGSFLILVSLIFEFNFPSFIIEIFWLVISIYGITKFLQTRAKRRKL